MQRRILTARLTAERQNLEGQLETDVESQVAQQFEDRANLERRIETDVALQPTGAPLLHELPGLSAPSHFVGQSSRST
jgi:hypothetical protein